MVREKKLESILLISWMTSFVATFGSLYFSEVMKFEPCKLCWFQRIFMYPLVLILGTAIKKKNYNIGLYSLIISSVGACVSLYHYLIQKLPMQEAITCGRVPCTVTYLNWFGFITIPLLALIAFIIILSISLVLIRMNKELNDK